MSKDNVNHPKHYNQGKYECIDVVEDLWGSECPFAIFNAFKYIWRYKDKENSVEDLKKAVFYLQWYISKKEEEESKGFKLPNGVTIREFIEGFSDVPLNSPERFHLLDTRIMSGKEFLESIKVKVEPEEENKELKMMTAEERTVEVKPIRQDYEFAFEAYLETEFKGNEYKVKVYRHREIPCLFVLSSQERGLMDLSQEELRMLALTSIGHTDEEGVVELVALPGEGIPDDELHFELVQDPCDE